MRFHCKGRIDINIKWQGLTLLIDQADKHSIAFPQLRCHVSKFIKNIYTKGHSRNQANRKITRIHFRQYIARDCKVFICFSSNNELIVRKFFRKFFWTSWASFLSSQMIKVFATLPPPFYSQKQDAYNFNLYNILQQKESLQYKFIRFLVKRRL